MSAKKKSPKKDPHLGRQVKFYAPDEEVEAMKRRAEHLGYHTLTAFLRAAATWPAVFPPEPGLGRKRPGKNS